MKASVPSAGNRHEGRRRRVDGHSSGQRASGVPNDPEGWSEFGCPARSPEPYCTGSRPESWSAPIVVWPPRALGIAEELGPCPLHPAALSEEQGRRSREGHGRTKASVQVGPGCKGGAKPTRTRKTVQTEWPSRPVTCHVALFF